MNKTLTTVIGAIVVLAILIGGGFALFHKSNNTNNMTGTNHSAGSASTVSSNSVSLVKSNSSLGQYLTTPNGQPLYTYNGDTNGVSNCTGSCLANWPAYQDKGATTNLPTGVSTITRKDNGQLQYTYNGLPLYTFISDSNGQVTGNGVENFSIAKPAAASSSSSSSSSSASSSNSSNSSNSGYPY